MLAAVAWLLSQPGRRAQTLLVGNNGQAPPCEPSGQLAPQGRTALAKTAHPIVNFDKSGQRTLESFNSHAGNSGRSTCSTGSDRSESDCATSFVDGDSNGGACSASASVLDGQIGDARLDRRGTLAEHGQAEG